MKGQTNPSIIDNSLQRGLRSHMTDAENRLWQRLRGRQIAGFKFRRPHPFLDFVLDFACPRRGIPGTQSACLEKRLIVEVDGSQHQDSEPDRVRDRRLHEAGFKVLRFWNNQVLQEIDAVVEAIWTALDEKSVHGGSHSSPSPPRPSP